jgi:putative ABC transport system ATP-binding protein
MLQLRDVVKYYKVPDGQPVRALDGVSLQVAEGELVALYGPSGSGKTTLLSLVAALLSPDEGQVIVNGRDLSKLSEQESSSYRLRELGHVDQSLDLLPGGTVVENAALKLWLTIGVRKGNERVLPLLDRLSMGGRLDHAAATLSNGERQRVLIARALSTEPRVVLADEPTAHLDSDNAGEVLALFGEACRERGVAVLLATHDMHAASFADRVYTLRDGRLEILEGELHSSLSTSTGHLAE